MSKELAQFDWDYDGESVIVQASHIGAVLEGFISDKFSAKDLEDWANLIECREDLDYADSKREELEEVIDALANPVLQGKITKQSCESYLNQIEG